MKRERGGLRVLGHPAHPMLTDIPIALWALTLVWDLVALWSGGVWWQVSFWTLALGLIAALPTAASGLIDSRNVEADSPAQRTVNLHMLLMGLAVSIFVGNLLIRGGAGQLDGLRAGLAIGASALGVALVGAGAWFGGELVFRYGTGVAADQEARDTAARPEVVEGVAERRDAS